MRLTRTAPMVDCDFDYDGFGGGPFRLFLRWNRTRYATLEEVRKRAPVYKHAVLMDAASAFASGALPPSDMDKPRSTPSDFRLASGSAAVDAGAVLPGLNDGFHSRRPDLGAYELGDPLPHYGPRVPVGRGGLETWPGNHSDPWLGQLFLMERVDGLFVNNRRSGPPCQTDRSRGREELR